MPTHTSLSITDTKAIAQSFARTLKAGDVVAFVGGMGAGKTAFTRYMLAELGITERVQSPTFAIVNEYKTPAGIGVYHFDMYRVSSADELDTTGYYDYLDSVNSILIVEWSENIANSIPHNARYVKIKTISETEREIEIC